MARRWRAAWLKGSPAAVTSFRRRIRFGLTTRAAANRPCSTSAWAAANWKTVNRVPRAIRLRIDDPSGKLLEEVNAWLGGEERLKTGYRLEKFQFKVT